MPAQSQREDAAFDLTPMIDVTFLLIIFFMCVTEMAHIEFESLTLPFARQSVKDSPAPPKRQVVNVRYTNLDGSERSEIVVRRRVFDETNRLADFLREQDRMAHSQGQAEGIDVKIRADGRSEYQKIQQVLVACMKAGISRISIVASPNPRYQTTETETKIRSMP